MPGAKTLPTILKGGSEGAGNNHRFSRSDRIHGYNKSMLADKYIQRFVGREPERLSLQDRKALLGKWIAMEVYTPATLPLRRIEAVGDSVVECIGQIRKRGLDTSTFEFSQWRSV